MPRSLASRATTSVLLLVGLISAACGSTAVTQAPASPTSTAAATASAAPVTPVSATPVPATPLPATPVPPTATPGSTPVSPSSSPRQSAAPTPVATASPAATPAAGGSIIVGDAGAVDPLSRAVGAAAQASSPGLQVTYQQSEDFSLFCAGSLDVYGAARKIDAQKDAKACVTNGVEFLELKVAINATAVVATVADQGIGCLAVQDLYALFGPESTGIVDWQDVSTLAQAVGSGSQFDALPLTVAGPPAESPASQLLIAKAIAPVAADRGKDPVLRSDYMPAADDAALIAALSGVPAGGIGWSGLGAVLQHADVIRAVRIDSGDGCVTADAAKAGSGAYPLSQPVYLYVNATSATDNAAIGAFVDAYLSDDTQASIVAALSYLPVNPGDLDDARFAWENR